MKKSEKLNCRKNSDSNYKRKRFIILIYKEHIHINKQEISGYGNKKKKKQQQLVTQRRNIHVQQTLHFFQIICQGRKGKFKHWYDPLN